VTAASVSPAGTDVLRHCDLSDHWPIVAWPSNRSRIESYRSGS